MSKFKERVIYWSQIFLVPIYGLSFLMPRNKNIWLFGSTFGRRFADNPRYLYLYINDLKDKKIRPVWVSHRKDIVKWINDNGYEAYYYHSMKGILMALRAGVYVFDNYSKDINFWQSGGAVKVNLWHGSGNKLTNHDNEFDKVRHPKNLWQKWTTWLRRLSDEKPSHYILSTSEAKAKENMSAFQCSREHTIINGQPRNDMLVSNYEYEIKNLLTDYEKENLERIKDDKSNGSKIICFMPTFRPSEKKFFETMDFESFDKYLDERNYKLYVKPHPKSRILKELEGINYKNIVPIKAEVDVYTFLNQVDFMIADYSSAYTDFMLLEKPVVAFWFDETEYVTQNRESYIKMEEYMPEVVARNMPELMDSIDKIFASDTCIDARMKSRTRYFAKTNGYYAKDMYNSILEIIK